MLEKLWKLYEEAVWEEAKLKRKEECESEENKGFNMIESICANGKANGILRCIETLSEDPKEAWMKSFEIWARANKNVEAYDYWMPCSKDLPKQTGWYARKMKQSVQDISLKIIRGGLQEDRR